MARLAVAAVTGSRADWGLLEPVVRALAGDPAFALSLLATGAHLDPAFGDTLGEVAASGIPIAAEIPAAAPGDDALAVGRATARGIEGFAGHFARRRPDLLLLLGDRYEIFAAATAALFARIPIAHLCGGDTTEGAFDEALRHAISKMSHLHFPTNAPAARRLIAMGEDPARVHVVGNPALDKLRDFRPLERTAFLDAVGLPPAARLLLVAFHPATLDPVPSAGQLEALLAVLAAQPGDTAILLTGSNADSEGRALSRRLAAFAAARPATVYRASLGHRLYFNALTHADCLLGNSSSGLYEAPSFKLPTVNIGSRQRGRLRAASVIDCPPEAAAIGQALREALALDCAGVTNPYGDGRAAERVLAVLKGVDEPQTLVMKRFYQDGGTS